MRISRLFMKVYRNFLVLLVLAATAFGFGACGGGTGFDEYRYGVFLGADEVSGSMAKYGLVVLDADFVVGEQISDLKEQGSTVYSYLNVGTVETYRDYYNLFEGFGILLDVYEDWSDERFIDVSDVRWQSYVVDVIAKGLVDNNTDGFFLDNFDVYYNYGRQAAFLDGLITILRGLKDKYKLPIMINGGDAAVKEIIKTHPELIDAVNQECVFTGIDFYNGVFTVQDADTRKYYQDYLNTCKNKGISVYLLEYGDKVPRKQIDDYCKDNGYVYYISKNLDLTEALCSAALQLQFQPPNHLTKSEDYNIFKRTGCSADG